MLIPSHPDVPKDLSYDQAKVLCKSSDLMVRSALAGHPNCPPEVLYFLASDKEAAVRFIVAQNERTPRQADMLLASDSDKSIRERLAEKISHLTPQLPQDSKDKLSEATLDVLDKLVRDKMPEVRQIISDTLKDVANAPREIIVTLANDRELSVSEPVLRYSPVLTDEDLIEIITSNPIDGAMDAISRRDGVTDVVSDAIVQNAGDDTIAVLLSNQSAQIREETLDLLVDRAEKVGAWHEPMIQRPVLPSRCAKRLAGFIAMDLLEKLEKRVDMDPETLRAVKNTVQQRIEGEKKGNNDEDMEDHVRNEVKRLYRNGSLTSDMIEDRLADGERRFVVESMAILGNLETSLINDVVRRRDPELLVAIAWRAGLSAHVALQLQIHLAKIPPSRLIGPKNGTEYQLSDDEMEKALQGF